jgi:hypothetical protein
VAVGAKDCRFVANSGWGIEALLLGNASNNSIAHHPSKAHAFGKAYRLPLHLTCCWLCSWPLLHVRAVAGKGGAAIAVCQLHGAKRRGATTHTATATATATATTAAVDVAAIAAAAEATASCRRLVHGRGWLTCWRHALLVLTACPRPVFARGVDL